MNKKIVAIILNILIIILGLTGIGIAVKLRMTKDFFLYYTNLSNVFAVISSIIYLLTINKKTKLGKILRFSSTTCLMLTLLVVIFILTPMLKVNLFIGNYMPLYHLIIPVISLISLIFFEQKETSIISALIPTIIYGIITIYLNIIKVIEGPYPFLKVHNQKVITTILWILVIYFIDYSIALLVKVISKKIELK